MFPCVPGVHGLPAGILPREQRDSFRGRDEPDELVEQAGQAGRAPTRERDFHR